MVPTQCSPELALTGPGVPAYFFSCQLDEDCICWTWDLCMSSWKFIVLLGIVDSRAAGLKQQSCLGPNSVLKAALGIELADSCLQDSKPVFFSLFTPVDWPLGKLMVTSYFAPVYWSMDSGYRPIPSIPISLDFLSLFLQELSQ